MNPNAAVNNGPEINVSAHDTADALDRDGQGGNKREEDKPDKQVEVAISTTSGFFPDTGFDRVPARQKVEVQLAKASRKLHLADTSGWIATVNKRPIDPAHTYVDNQLQGEVEIDWGPSEGGGGAHA